MVASHPQNRHFHPAGCCQALISDSHCGRINIISFPFNEGSKCCNSAYTRNNSLYRWVNTTPFSFDEGSKCCNGIYTYIKYSFWSPICYNSSTCHRILLFDRCPGLITCWKDGGRQYKVVILDIKPKALWGGRYLSILVCALWGCVSNLQ